MSPGTRPACILIYPGPCAAYHRQWLTWQPRCLVHFIKVPWKGLYEHEVLGVSPVDIRMIVTEE
jgi:hypothetical protein